MAALPTRLARRWRRRLRRLTRRRWLLVWTSATPGVPSETINFYWTYGRACQRAHRSNLRWAAAYAPAEPGGYFHVEER